MRQRSEHHPDAHLRGRQLRVRDLLLSRRPIAAAVFAGALLLTPHLAAAEPDAPPPMSLPAEALMHDLAHLVDAEGATGWKVDRYEIDSMIADALMSLCATPEPARRAALAALDARVAALGGPVEQAYRDRGGDLDEVADLLFETRVRALLAEAIVRAPDECPFWVTPSETFRGIQTDDGRFTVNLEGGGLLVLNLEGAAGGATLGGGGSGRLLLGYGLGQEWSVLSGFELGGAALFKQSEEATQLPIQFVLAVPVVLRHKLLTWHHDLEVAPVAFFTQKDEAASYGVRFGMLLGLSTVRVRNILPWVGVGAAYEGYFKSPDRSWFSRFTGGARLGFDWDF